MFQEFCKGRIVHFEKSIEAILEEGKQAPQMIDRKLNLESKLNLNITTLAEGEINIECYNDLIEVINTVEGELILDDESNKSKLEYMKLHVEYAEKLVFYDTIKIETHKQELQLKEIEQRLGSQHSYLIQINEAQRKIIERYKEKLKEQKEKQRSLIESKSSLISILEQLLRVKRALNL